MDAEIISLQKWKAEHPPELVLWQHALQAGLAWQRLWLMLLIPRH